MRKVLFLLLMFVYNFAFSANYTTTGNSTNWNDPTAWDCNCVPSIDWSGHTATINHPITYTGDMNLYNDFHLTINDTLNVTGAFRMTWHNSSLTMNSGSELNSNSMTLNGGAPNLNLTGTINVTNTFLLDGDRIIEGDLILNANNVTIDGGLNTTTLNMTVENNILFRGDGYSNIGGGTIHVKNNFNSNGGVDLIIGADIQVDNDMNLTGSANIEISETLTVSGNLDFSGTGKIEGTGIAGWNTIDYTCICGDVRFECDDGTTYAGDNQSPFNPLDLTTCNTALPIELLYFDVKVVGDNDIVYTEIYWATSSETNNDYFTIEKSIDIEAKKFEPVGDVSGVGNSNELVEYSFLDYGFDRDCYYRLKQTDFDGQYSYSKIEHATNIGIANIDFILEDDYIFLTHKNPLNYTIVDVSGITHKTGILEEYKYAIDVIDLHTGIYIFKVYDIVENNFVVFKFNIQR